MGVGFKDRLREDEVRDAGWGQDPRHMKAKDGCVHLETSGGETVHRTAVC